MRHSRTASITRRIPVTVLALLALAPPLSAANLAQDWTLETADGVPVTLGEVAARQPTVLLFWATWCPYCKALMPHLQSIRLEYGDDVRILAIDIFDDGDPVAFMQEAGYDFTLLPRGDDVAKLYGIEGTPGVLIIDAQRRIHFDLRQAPRMQLPAGAETAGNARKAAYRAPYWAAQIRRSLDALLAEGP